METLTYKGIIQENNYGDGQDLLFVGDSDEPLAEILQDRIWDRQVSVRYYISDKEKSKDELQESFIKKISGAVDVDFGDRYSEITGYLWTDEELKIGGHDILKELRSHLGKFVYLEIDVHEQPVATKKESWDDIKSKIYVGSNPEDDNIDWVIGLLIEKGYNPPIKK